MKDRENILRHAQQWEAAAGESRVNLIRIAVIVVFYVQHWVLYSRVEVFTAADERFHGVATLIVVLWGTFASLLQLLLSRIPRPQPWIAYLATGIDLALITLLIISSPQGGPRSVLIVLYFVIATSLLGY